MKKVKKMLAGVYKALATAWLKLSCGKALRVQGIVGVRFSSRVRCKRGGTICLQKGVATRRNAELVAVDGGRLCVGENTYFNMNTLVACRDRIEIGSGCSFGPNVCLYDHDHNFDLQGMAKGYKTAPIVIGDRCWIGAGCMILRGTTIGDGCVIGAGTVVSGQIPAHSIVKTERKLKITPIEER